MGMLRKRLDYVWYLDSCYRSRSTEQDMYLIIVVVEGKRIGL